MTLFHVFLLVLVIGIVHHSHGRTNESESITINGSTDTLPEKAGTNEPPLRPPPIRPGKCEYESLYLSLQWPKSFCNTPGVECISWIPQHFTVHGLWPQPYNVLCTHCNRDDNFDYAQVLRGEVYDYMYNNWPTLKVGGDNYTFWDYEYQKHGSCYSPFRNNRGLYFQKTVELVMKRIGNVTSMLLDKGGIQLDTHYSRRHFEEEIYRLLSFIPVLQYKRGQLIELRFCVNASFDVTDCGRNSNSDNSQVMIPRQSVTNCGRKWNWKLEFALIVSLTVSIMILEDIRSQHLLYI